jgi:hypothetical protein
LKFGSKVPLKKQRKLKNMRLSSRRGLQRFWNLIEGLGLIQTGIKMSEDID